MSSYIGSYKLKSSSRLLSWRKGGGGGDYNGIENIIVVQCALATDLVISCVVAALFAHWYLSLNHP